MDEGTGLEDNEIVDRNHVAFEFQSHMNAESLVRSPDTSAKSVSCAVGDFDSFRDSIVGHDEHNRREGYYITLGKLSRVKRVRRPPSV